MAPLLGDRKSYGHAYSNVGKVCGVKRGHNSDENNTQGKRKLSNESKGMEVQEIR